MSPHVEFHRTTTDRIEELPDAVEQIVHTKPWQTLTYGVFRFVRFFVITLFGLPYLVAISTQYRLALLFAPLLFVADLGIRKRTPDYAVDESAVVRAAIRRQQSPFYPSPDISKQIIRPALAVAFGYGAVTACAALAVSLTANEAIRHAVGVAFVLATSAVAIVAAAYASLHAAPLFAFLQGREPGPPLDDSHNVFGVAALAGDVHWSIGFLYFLPARIRSTIFFSFYLLLIAFSIFLHASALSALLVNPNTSFLLITGAFSAVMWLMCGGMTSLPRSYAIQRTMAAFHERASENQGRWFGLKWVIGTVVTGLIVFSLFSAGHVMFGILIILLFFMLLVVCWPDSAGA